MEFAGAAWSKLRPNLREPNLFYSELPQREGEFVCFAPPNVEPKKKIEPYMKLGKAWRLDLNVSVMDVTLQMLSSLEVWRIS